MSTKIFEIYSYEKIDDTGIFEEMLYHANAADTVSRVLKDGY